MEILVLVKDSAAPGVQKTGDVTAIQPDGWRWGREELTDSRWRIIRTERPLLQTHVTSLLFAPRVDSFLGAEHYRAWAIALAKLPSAAKILGPRRGMIDVPATAIEDATFQRPITGKIPPRPAVTMSKIGALLALLPGTKRGEKPRLWSRRSVLRGVAVLAGIMLLARRAQAGTITKTIGSAGGRDYTTVQAFIDALPANLVTDGNSYVGDCYNDSEFTGTGTLITIGAHTTDATHTITITAAPGQSFKDNASVRTNALKYNASNGVGIRKTDDYASVLLISGANDYITISRLQFSKSATGAGAPCVYVSIAGCDHLLLQDLICEQAGSSGICVLPQGSSARVINVLAIVRSSNAIHAFSNEGGNVLYVGCGAVRPSDFTAGGTGFARAYSTPILTSCYSFGFTTASASGFDAASGNNATDQTSIAGSTNQTSVTYSSSTPFQNAADSTRDFRAIVSTALAANGVRDSTNAPNDISGVARPSTPTIGPWELVTAVAKRRGAVI